MNGPTPWIGVFERLTIGVFRVWIVALATMLWNAPGTADNAGKEHGPFGRSSGTRVP